MDVLDFVIGHRGAKGYIAENTLLSINHAIELGCKYVEIDVRLTKDKQLVVIHDKDVNRTTNGSGLVKDMLLGEIKKFLIYDPIDNNIASNVPSLQDVINLISRYDGISLNIEMKADKGNERELGEIVADFVLNSWPKNIPNPLISSFDFEALSGFQSRCQSCEIALLYTRLPGRFLRDYKKYNAQSIHIMYRFARKKTIRRVTSLGIPVRVYTVNRVKKALKLRRWGVASVFSDKPDLIINAICGKPKLNRSQKRRQRKELKQQISNGELYDTDLFCYIKH